ncbi:MAG: cadherin domain-containing protein [Betaproteobacteria bacterium]|nr:cadherin domain-containing protein [Betaproteobacteria bacterium]
MTLVLDQDLPGSTDPVWEVEGTPAMQVRINPVSGAERRKVEVELRQSAALTDGTFLSLTLSATSSSGTRMGFQAYTRVRIEAQDSGINVNTSGLLTLTSTQRKFSLPVKLLGAPAAANVTLTITSDEPDSVGVYPSPATLVFSTSSWDSVQNIELSLTDAGLMVKKEVGINVAVHNASGSDSNYRSVDDVDFAVVANLPNQAPVFADTQRVRPVNENIGSAEYPVGTSIGAPVVATDQDNDDNTELTYSLARFSTLFDVVPTSGQIVLKRPLNMDFENEEFTGYLLTLKVEDNERTAIRGRATVTVAITIVNVDEPPDLEVLDDQLVIQGNQETYQFSAPTDPEKKPGLAYSYSLKQDDGSNPPAGVSLDGNSRTFTFASSLAPQVVNLSLRVTDSDNKISFRKFKLKVIASSSEALAYHRTANCDSCHGDGGGRVFSAGGISLKINDATFRSRASNAFAINSFLNGVTKKGATSSLADQVIADAMNYVYKQLNTPAVNMEMTAEEVAGGKMFNTSCSTAGCHGKTGGGDANVPPLNTDGFRAKDQLAMLNVILNGAGTMPAFNLNASEQEQILAYLYSSINNVIFQTGGIAIDRSSQNALTRIARATVLPVRLAKVPSVGNVTLTITSANENHVAVYPDPSILVFAPGNSGAAQNITLSLTDAGLGVKGTRNVAITVAVHDPTNAPSNFQRTSAENFDVAVNVANLAPVFTNPGSLLRSINEGVYSANQVVGAAVTAADQDNLPGGLEYEMASDDSGLFDVVEDSGQIRLKNDVALNHEGTEIYLITMAVEDGEEGGAVGVVLGRSVAEVTISITDVDEPPSFQDEQTNLKVSNLSSSTFTIPGASDPENDPFTFSASLLNPAANLPAKGLSFNPGSRTFSVESGASPTTLTVYVRVEQNSDSNLLDEQRFILVIEGLGAARINVDKTPLSGKFLSRATRKVVLPVQLNNAPAGGNVTLTISGTNESHVAVYPDPATLVFTPGDSSTAQNITLSLTDAGLGVKGSRNVAITVAVHDPDNAPNDYQSVFADNFIVPVRVANEVPQFDVAAIGQRDFSINETQFKTRLGFDTVIGTAVVAIDADNDDNADLTYSLVGAPSQFAINQDSAVLSAVKGAKLNYEQQGSYELVVRVSDGETSGGSDVAEGVAMVTVTVQINNVAEKPSAYTRHNFRVVGAGRNDITLAWNNDEFENQFDEEDRSQVVVLYEGGGYSGDRILDATVTIVQLSGLVPGVAYDMEILWQSADAQVQDTPIATQGGAQMTEANAAPVLGGLAFSRPENEGTAETVAGTVVATVTVTGGADGMTDADGDAVTYSIRGGTDAGLFVIDSQSGEVRLARSVNFDHEAKASYTFAVAAADGYGAVVAGDLVLNIAGVDEDPSLPLQYAHTATAGVESMFMLRGTAAATDPEGEGNLRYQASLAGGASLPSWLTLDDETGQFTVGTAAEAGTYNIMVRAVVVPRSSSLAAVADGGPVALNVVSEQMFVLEVLASSSTNTVPDFSSADTEFTIAENSEQAAGAAVGAVVAADTETAANALIYSLRGDDAADFAIGTGGVLVVGSSAVTFDRESKDEYRFVVDVADGAGGVASTDVKVEITNVNEAPEFSAVAQRTFQVVARATNTFLAPRAFDPEASAISYTATNPGAWLTFDAMKAEFTVGVNAPIGVHPVTLTASDGSLSSAPYEFMVQVQTSGNKDPVVLNAVAGVLSLPQFVLASRTEMTPAGTSIGRVVATDLDGDDLVYSKVEGDDADLFEVDMDSGQVMVANGRVFAPGIYSFMVDVFDGSGGMARVMIEVEFELLSFTSPAGTAATVSAEDQEQHQVAALVMDRALAVVAVDMLQKRLNASPPATKSAALLERAESPSYMRLASAVDQWKDWRYGQSDGDRIERMAWQDFLYSSGFDLALDSGGGSGSRMLRMWGSGSKSNLDGSPNIGATPVLYDGSSRLFMLGFDAGLVGKRIGVAASKVKSELDFAGSEEAHAYRELTSVHPYLRFDINKRFQIWASGSFGKGDYVRTDKDGAQTSRDSDYLSAAGGVVSDWQYGIFELAAGAKVLMIQSNLSALPSSPEVESNFWRAEAEFEVAPKFLVFSDVALRPFVGLHLHYDKDKEGWLDANLLDATSGISFDWAGGLSAELGSRWQTNDENVNEERWDANISYDFEWDGRGLMLSVAPSMASSTDEEAEYATSARVGYGLPMRLFADPGLATLQADFSAGERSVQGSYGFRFAGRRLEADLSAAKDVYKFKLNIR